MEEFLTDVHAGLSCTPKTLSSKYFYDARGDDLFVKIMAMPEYYLTRAEMEIFVEQSDAIVDTFGQSPNRKFELVELGAGDGSKTRKLLEALYACDYKFDYVPIDISRNALTGLQQSLKKEMPWLSITPKVGDYFQKLAELSKTHHPKVILFLGSNIGNLLDSEAHDFIDGLAKNLNTGDHLLLGVDLIKSADIVLPAYDDPQGLTRDFNLNLLRRINKELGGNFNLEQFEHHAEYTAKEGIARSYLVSKVRQDITLDANQQTYSFLSGERIRTEISRKYNERIINHILGDTRFSVNARFTDKAKHFADYVLEVTI